MTYDPQRSHPPALQQMDHVEVSKRVLQFPTGSFPRRDYLTVHNPSSETLAFKVKTTNQNRYIVRPNVGTIASNGSTTIMIELQSGDLIQAGPCKDKFLLQTTPAGSDELPPDFWVGREREVDPGVVEIKFKVTFVDESGGDQLQDAVGRVKELQAVLNKKNLELARLRMELAETRAETERVLKEAPTTPISANKVLSDPFGGVSVAGFGLMLLLFLVLVNVILRLL